MYSMYNKLAVLFAIHFSVAHEDGGSGKSDSICQVNSCICHLSQNKPQPRNMGTSDYTSQNTQILHPNWHAIRTK